MSRLVHIGIGLGVLLLVGCEPDEQHIPDERDLPYPLEIPVGFPSPEIGDDIPLTRGRVALGKELFFDLILSKDFSVSCGSCHQPEFSFTDQQALPIGVEQKLGERNSPQLANVAYKPYFFKDGGIPTLELQVFAPFDNHLEFDLNIVDAIDRLNNSSYYVTRFREVFGENPSVFGLTRAIAAYERTLLSGNSRYDQHFLQDKDVLTDAELRGYELFMSDELNCGSCHSGVFFTNYEFENIGLELNYADSGRARITLDPADAGKFEVPTLRNIAVTGPYMFDGRFETLEEVIDFFASGGLPHPNRSEKLTPFELTGQEKTDLIAFLESLTDEEFLANTAHQP